MPVHLLLRDSALGKRLESEQGDDDVRHIKKICLMANSCAALGLAVTTIVLVILQRTL